MFLSRELTLDSYSPSLQAVLTSRRSFYRSEAGSSHIAMINRVFDRTKRFYEILGVNIPSNGFSPVYIYSHASYLDQLENLTVPENLFHFDAMCSTVYDDQSPKLESYIAHEVHHSLGRHDFDNNFRPVRSGYILLDQSRGSIKPGETLEEMTACMYGMMWAGADHVKNAPQHYAQALNLGLKLIALGGLPYEVLLYLGRFDDNIKAELVTATDLLLGEGAGKELSQLTFTSRTIRDFAVKRGLAI